MQTCACVKKQRVKNKDKGETKFSLLKSFTKIALTRDAVSGFHEIFKDWKIFSRFDMW